MKKIFVIDWLMIPAFVAMAYTGIVLHVAADAGSHEVWHNRAVAHVIAALAFLVVMILHVRTHWAWYCGWLKLGLGKRSRITALLSVMYAIVTLTGIILLPVEGVGTGLGTLHFVSGIIVIILSIGHIFKRIPALRRSL